jgi:hypothetical protein
MDFFSFDFLGRLGCSDHSVTPEKLVTPSLQITLRYGGEDKFKFVKTNEKTIKFYSDDNSIQEFSGVDVIPMWLKQFLNFNASYQIVWHREGEKGMVTPYNEDSLHNLLKLLLSDEVL